MDIWAIIGVYIDWPWPAPNQDVSIGATLSGDVLFTPGNPWHVEGELKGSIKVVGLKFSFKMPLDKDL